MPTTASAAPTPKITQGSLDCGGWAICGACTAAGGGAETARDDLRTTVKQVFDGEDPREPYSDDDVVRVMKERGHDLARRTVAKYRKELGIPSSYRRRRFE